MGYFTTVGMTPEEIAAEAAEAERETAEAEAKRQANWEAKLARKSKDSKYYWRNSARRKHETALRRARALGAVSNELSEEQEAEILAVYQAADSLSRVTGIRHEVDHIVPLVGKNKDGDFVICGLHIASNLRPVPWSLNRKRGDWFYIRDAERKFPSRARAVRESAEQKPHDEEIPF